MPVSDPLLEPTPPSTVGASASDASPVKLCLLILFNHRFEQNLPKLDWYYRGRFEHIRYLVPFYRGDRADVIATHYGSYQFQGFFLEAWNRLKSEGFTHFLICADDMLLHPGLTDKNFLPSIRLAPDSGYIKQLETLANRSLGWFPTGSGLVAVQGKNGVNWQQELPEPAAAAANLAAKGFPMGRLGLQNFRHVVRAKGFVQFLFYALLRVLQRRRDPSTDLRGLPYPLLAGNADILVVPAAYMDKFSFYSSVFAAMGLFVEIAAPTALALACPRVALEEDTGWTARDYFLGFSNPQECDEYGRRLGYDLERLLADFGPNVLCLHPIKLSQWKIPGLAA